MNSGKLVIVAILAVALVAAGFAWWFQSNQSARALDFWGSDVAHAIRLAEPVQVKRLVLAAKKTPNGDGASASDSIEDQPSGELIRVDARDFRVAATRDLTEAKGLVHARQALIQDASFKWNKPSAGEVADWDYLLEFGQVERASLLIDLESGQIRTLNEPRAATVNIVSGLAVFLDEQFAVDGP